MQAFVPHVANRSGLELSYHDAEDLQAFLVVEAWQLSERFDTTRGGSFPTYATTTLQRRCIDWNRQRLGRTVRKFRDRTYERQLPQLVSYEAEFASHAHGSSPAAPSAATTSGLRVDWDALSPNSVWTLNLAIPLWQGHSVYQLARRHQTTTGSVNWALDTGARHARDELARGVIAA